MPIKNIFLIENKLKWPFFWSFVSLLYALSINLFEFIGTPVAHFYGFISIALQWIIVSITSAGFLGILSINRIVFSIFFPILCLISAIEVYYRLTIGVGITGTTLEIALENGSSMWESVITIRLIIVVIFSLVLSIIIAIVRWKYVIFNSKSKFKIVYIFISLIFLFLPFIYQRSYGAITNRMPYAIYSSIKDYIGNHQEVGLIRDNFVNVVAERPLNPPNVIFVVGESLRADHLQLNGYERETTPLLSNQKNLISLPNMRSTGIHTYESMPFLFTLSDSANRERGYEEQSFITIFNKAGYNTAWIANQDIAQSYAYFAHETDTLIHVNSMRSLYTYDLWLDDDVLVPFKNWYFSKREKPSLTIIHTIGSHWWYKSHYTESEAAFKPEIDSKDIASLSEEQLLNSYDNSIIATDKFLNALIEYLKNENAIIIFVSDHGESLGEDGKWLHASEADELHDVACLIWFSDIYKYNFPEKISLLERNKSLPLSSDDMFHTIIDAADIRTDVLIPSKSIFNEKKN